MMLSGWRIGHHVSLHGKYVIGCKKAGRAAAPSGPAHSSSPEQARSQSRLPWTLRKLLDAIRRCRPGGWRDSRQSSWCVPSTN